MGWMGLTGVPPWGGAMGGWPAGPAPDGSVGADHGQSWWGEGLKTYRGGGGSLGVGLVSQPPAAPPHHQPCPLLG